MSKFMSHLFQKMTGVMTLSVVLFLLSGCDTELTVEENRAEANSTLVVAAMTVEESSISYPVVVYVFGDNGRCVEMQTIGDAAQALSIQLVEGKYKVVAIGGASSDKYELPTKENATEASLLTLNDGASHGDIMMSVNSVTLTDGVTNNLKLGMSRKIVELRSVTISKVPTDATAVSVTVSPLMGCLSLSGYGEETNASCVIALEKKADGDGRTWTMPAAQYILPSSAANSTTVSVSITRPDGESSTKTTAYTYNTTDKFEAAYKVDIVGVYTDAVGVTLTGAIQGAVWMGEKTISFNFNSSGTFQSTDDQGGQQPIDGGENAGEDGGSNPDPSGDEPTTTLKAGDVYQECYVISVDGNEALILSNKSAVVNLKGQSQDAARAIIAGKIPDCSVDGISGWRVITYEECGLLDGKRAQLNDYGYPTQYNKNEIHKFLCEHASGDLVTLSINPTGGTSYGGITSAEAVYVALVTTVQITD